MRRCKKRALRLGVRELERASVSRARLVGSAETVKQVPRVDYLRRKAANSLESVANRKARG
jgi:hypothetical protein